MERLGLEEGEEILPGITIQTDGGQSGNFRVLCDGQHDEGAVEIRGGGRGGGLHPGGPGSTGRSARNLTSAESGSRPVGRRHARRARAIIATSRSIVGHAIPCRAPARNTAPGIASSSGGRPAAMSRCIELPSVSCAAVSSPSGSPPGSRALRARDRAPLLDRTDQLGAQLGRRADLPERHVKGACGAGQCVQPHEL